MRDPMGGHETLNDAAAQQLVVGLSKHPSHFILFVRHEKKIVGLATCFVNFSTFLAKPYINVHDLIIHKEYRGNGLGKFLLETILSLANERGYGKVNLEVREDNVIAQSLYQTLGFQDTNPKMFFWTKVLTEKI
jgi:ribosomal protein S18 acetylase RimI-like enzyme